ncbi:hypothetical protein N5T77_03315 [Aliarcobacter cryaerophilus]|uniref:hypothetical protein n=1 Tax=Aliarcobacter cryaerophilus TaxID=28198 RepID=UPI0021B68A77|nr:hypothetical protein [Aliarcobacter cryaerophilus]MCT7524061.1 hypothetical protein [Aliarcobacter cryaerophilus]
MSNYTKKINKKSSVKKTSSMEKINEIYEMSFSFNKKCVVNVTSYNTNYFPSGNDFIDGYGLVVIDYIEFCNNQNKIIDFMDFIKDSVENNCMLNDMLFNEKFKISNDSIYFQIDNEKYHYVNQGEFHLNNYKCNVCNSYIFIENLTTGIQYIYYGD